MSTVFNIGRHWQRRIRVDFYFQNKQYPRKQLIN